MAKEVAPNPSGREFDHLLACGEQIAVSMVARAAGARRAGGVAQRGQCGIHTDGSFNRARIRDVETRRLVAELRAGKVVIVCGFQGVTAEHDITTLGRGGGDITGAALAAALPARVYENCTDVDGVYREIRASCLARVRFRTSVTRNASNWRRAARKCCTREPWRSVCNTTCPFTFDRRTGDGAGTWVREGAETMTMERPSVVGVTTDKKVAKVTLLDVIDQPGTAARVFRDLAEAEINVRLIIQAAPSHDRNRITFITELEALEPLAALIPSWKKEKLAGKVEIDADVAKIAIVGSRIASTPGLAARMFTALADEGINIDCISTSEMKVACIIAESSLDNAVKAVHAAFFDELAETNGAAVKAAAAKTAAAKAKPAAKTIKIAKTASPRVKRSAAGKRKSAGTSARR